jgi:hypothetical protein
MHEKTSKQGRLLRGVLFDPYKREISIVEVRNNLDVWHKLLRCSCVDVNRLMAPIDGHQSADLWFDDEFLMKTPVGPGFRFRSTSGRYLEYRGYGLLLSSDSEGQSTDFDLLPNPGDKRDDEATIYFWGMLFTHVQWEMWEKRLPSETFLDQQIRTPELEMDKDDFRVIAVLP